jgi:transposase
MRTVDGYAKYRTAHRDGMTIRQIARTFHVSRRTVREALASPEPTPYTRTKPPPAPVLGPFTAIIDQVLLDDRDAQLFRRLQDEHGYPGSYPTVRRYVGHSPPAVQPHVHPAGPPSGPPPRGPCGARLRAHAGQAAAAVALGEPAPAGTSLGHLKNRWGSY